MVYKNWDIDNKIIIPKENELSELNILLEENNKNKQIKNNKGLNLYKKFITTVNDNYKDSKNIFDNLDNNIWVNGLTKLKKIKTIFTDFDLAELLPHLSWIEYHVEDKCYYFILHFKPNKIFHNKTLTIKFIHNKLVYKKIYKIKSDIINFKDEYKKQLIDDNFEIINADTLVSYNKVNRLKKYSFLALFVNLSYKNIVADENEYFYYINKNSLNNFSLYHINKNILLDQQTKLFFYCVQAFYAIKKYVFINIIPLYYDINFKYFKNMDIFNYDNDITINDEYNDNDYCNNIKVKKSYNEYKIIIN